jgi:hypothetical protein
MKPISDVLFFLTASINMIEAFGLIYFMILDYHAALAMTL